MTYVKYPPQYRFAHQRRLFKNKRPEKFGERVEKAYTYVLDRVNQRDIAETSKPNCPKCYHAYVCPHYEGRQVYSGFALYYRVWLSQTTYEWKLVEAIYVYEVDKNGFLYDRDYRIRWQKGLMAYFDSVIAKHALQMYVEDCWDEWLSADPLTACYGREIHEIPDEVEAMPDALPIDLSSKTVNEVEQSPASSILPAQSESPIKKKRNHYHHIRSENIIGSMNCRTLRSRVKV